MGATWEEIAEMERAPLPSEPELRDSVYVLSCPCGRRLRPKTAESTCPDCGRIHLVEREN